MPGLYPENPIQCEDCNSHFQLTPGMATDGVACPECGGKRLFMNQPSPTQSDGTLRDMVDSDSQHDQGGNPLGEGTIVGGDGEKPFFKRDNFMHSKVAAPPSVMYEGTPDIPPEMSMDDYRQQPRTSICPLCEQPVTEPLGMSQHIQLRHPEFNQRQPMYSATSVTQKVEMHRSLNMEPYMPWTHEASTEHTAGPLMAVLPEAAGPALEALGLGSVGGIAGKIAPSLMKGVFHAGENALGLGGQSQSNPQSGGAGPEPVTPAPNMMSYGSADIPFLLVADLETPLSNPSVDEDEDDPQQQDQKEFNDGDDSPSNHKNPNNEDSGIDGEDGARNDTPGFGFGENSPGLERMMMVLPLLLHYFESPESGQSDPLVKGIHEMLESENPGYLKNEDPDGHGLIQLVIQNHKQPHGVHAGVGFPSGLPPVPGGAPQTAPQGGAAPGGGMCPDCGSPMVNGQCPVCGGGGGYGAQQNAVPGASMPPMMSNHVGPVTPEQIEAVAQLLLTEGRSGEIETMKQNPQLYWKELAQIQQQQNTAPLVDPSQSQPPMPMEAAPGAMPTPDMGGAPGGQPMQPMAGFEAHIAEHMAFRKGGPDPGDDAYFGGEAGSSEKAYKSMIEQYGKDKGEEVYYATRNKHKGKTADANNHVPRCPKCGTATTSLIAGMDNDPSKGLGKCHNPGCGHIWQLKDPTKESRQVWAELANPLAIPADQQHSPIDHQHTHDPTMTWADNSGQGLQAGQIYELHSPAYPVPDMVKVIDVKPDEIRVELVGQQSNLEPDGSGFDWPISRQEAQLEHYTFTPAQVDQDADDRNTEPPTGTPGLEQVPPSGPTTDQVQDSYPNTALSHVEPDNENCIKCGSHMIDHALVSPERSSHDCVRCGHYWESEEEQVGRESGVDLSWVLGSNGPDDFFGDMERARAMASAGGQSRSLASIAAKDDRLQQIKSVLESNAQARTAGRQFTHAERRELIDETGRARNLGDLDLSNTHYDTRVDYTGKANGDNVEESHFGLGL